MNEESRARIQNYIEYLLDNSSAEAPMWNIEQIRSGKPNKWNYIDGCMINAVLSLYEFTGEKRYLDFADGFIGWFVNEDGTIKTYDPQEKNIDNINEARNLFRLYDLTGKEKYRKPWTWSAASWTSCPGQRKAASGTSRSIPGRYGWTASTWPSPSTWNMRPATTG